MGTTAIWGFVALSLPLAVALASLHRGHHGDIAVFRSWYDAIKDTPSRMYMSPRHDVNYPVVGVAVAVAPGFVAPGDAFAAATKLLLVPWNALLILAFAGASRGLRLPWPRMTAALFYLVPSTWVCAMYFGQIDGVTTALQLACAWAGIEMLGKARTDLRGSVVCFIVAVLALQTSLLTKQLAAFALPGLVALVLLGLALWHKAGHRRAAYAGLAGLVLSFGLLRLPDAFLALPAGFHSHVALVFLGAGPAHSEMIGNAPGIFAFADLAPDASSLTLIAPELAPRLTAQSLGHAVFGAFAILSTALFARAVLRTFGRGEPHALASTALLYAGLCHLGVAVLVAGAHERYLFNAFPLLALGIGARRWLQLACFFVAAVYGTFVLSTIEWDAFAAVALLRSTRLCAVLCLALLGAATIELMVRGGSGRTNDGTVRQSPSQIRNYGVFMLIAGAVLSMIAIRRHVALPFAVAPVGCGALLAVLAVAAPAIVRPLAEAWADLGHVLGRVTTPILLAIVFALVVVPLGLLMRVLGNDILKLRRDPKASTYWIERKRRTFEPGDFERLS